MIKEGAHCFNREDERTILFIDGKYLISNYIKNKLSDFTIYLSILRFLSRLWFDLLKIERVNIWKREFYKIKKKDTEKKDFFIYTN